jgi:hypothetical protein
VSLRRKYSQTAKPARRKRSVLWKNDERAWLLTSILSY